MTRVELSGVSKSFGTVKIIRDLNLVFEPGEFVVLVGPSGCGKSTLLRMIAGLEDINGGELRIDGERMNDVHPSSRGIAMVFQSYALYPHMSVYKNLAFGLETARFDKTEIDRRVREAAARLQIEGLLERKPRQLSGGQRQRVAIGRAIVREPRLFLFDEPLSNLDAELRVQMRVELAKLHKALGVTMVYVTHDQVEAMTMADRIVVMRGGVVEQVGRPLELYNRPANRFVAGFIGSPKMNFLDLGDRSISADFPDGRHAITIGVRPEHLRIDGDADVTIGRAIPQIVEHLGGSTIVHAKLEDGQSIAIELDGQRDVARGEALVLGARIDNCHFFDARGAVVLPVGT